MSSAIELLIMHHENMRILYPEDELMVLCECDGSLYDMRVLALQALQSFDRAHGTSFFKSMTIAHLPLILPDIDELLGYLLIPVGISTEIARWYCKNFWNMDSVCSAHHRLKNVMNVLKALQTQDRTCVGLCTARSGRSDSQFLNIINTLVQPVGMQVCPEHVFLDDNRADPSDSDRIIRAWQSFHTRGYRLIAAIDSRFNAEPGHVFSMDTGKEVMFLQSRAVREMQNISLAPRVLNEPDFSLWDLLNENVRLRIPDNVCTAHAAARHC